MKSRDQLGVPVSFNFNGKDEHTTVFGGLCSCMVHIFSLGLTVAVFAGFFFDPDVHHDVHQSIILNYLNMSVESERYSISTWQSMPTVKLIDRHAVEDQVDLSTYVNIYYLVNEVVNEETRELTHVFHEAVECLEIPFIRDNETLNLFY